MNTQNKILTFLITCFLGSVLYAANGRLDRTSGEVDAFTVACGTDPTVIEPSGVTAQYTSVRCGNISLTPIFIGGKEVSTRDGYPLASRNTVAPDQSITLNAGKAYCRVASLTVTLYCVALRD